MTLTQKPKHRTNYKPTIQSKSLKWWENSKIDTEQWAKWISLYEAVNLIFDKAEERGMNLEDVELPPIKIKEYMDSTVDNIQRKLLEDEYRIKTYYSESE